MSRRVFRQSGTFGLEELEVDRLPLVGKIEQTFDDLKRRFKPHLGEIRIERRQRGGPVGDRPYLELHARRRDNEIITLVERPIPFHIC